MEKRLILAIALSLLVLLSWSALISKHTPSVKPLVSLPPPQIMPKEEIPPSSLLKFSQEKYEVIFMESQGAIKEVVFKAYQSTKFNLEQGFLLLEPNLIFKQENVQSENEIRFVQSDKNKKIIKDFIFSNYAIELDITIENLSNLPLKVNFPLILGVLNFAGDPNETRYQDVCVATQEKILHLNARKDMVFDQVKFLGLRNRYFTAIVEPTAKNHYIASVKKISPQRTEVGLSSTEITLQIGQKIEQKFHIYLGPQELKLINQANPDWTLVMHYGTFNLISQFLLQLLEFIHNFVHNWGWTIIILSFIIYLVFYPLTLKQMRSMKEMQVLQPAIEELRQTYKNNPQKLNKEIMELYRLHKVNPFGGCLPLILQLPIFFALYQALMRSIALKGAHFLWIKDLSEPDRLFILPLSLPILGNELNILPIVMTIGMFWQQKISTVSASTSSAEQQKLMRIIFPLMFGFIFYRMPSGLVLYWFINSSLMLLYQWRISTSNSPSANSERSRTLSRLK